MAGEGRSIIGEIDIPIVSWPKRSYRYCYFEGKKRCPVNAVRDDPVRLSNKT